MDLSCVAVARAAGLGSEKEKRQEILFLCPNHDDHDPSLSINPEKNCWICHPCGAGGNAWALVAFLIGCDPLDKPAVTKWLKEHDLLNGDGLAGLAGLAGRQAGNKQKQLHDDLPPIPPETVEQLHQDLNDAARDYLRKSRCLTDEVIDRYMLGKSDRLTIPVADSEGVYRDVRRWASPEKRNNKRKMLHWATGYGDIRWYPIDQLASQELVFCEGELDALAAISSGIPAITVTGGAGTSVKRHSKPVTGKKFVLAGDNDKASRKGDQKRAKNLVRNGAHVRIIKWPEDRPEGWDVTDEIREHGADSLRKIIEAAEAFQPLETTSDRKPEPRPLQRDIPDPTTYPIDALGSTLALAAETFKNVVQAPPAICGNSLLAAAAVAVQGHANVIIDGRESPCSEYLVTVGFSGERKSAVDRLALKPHWDYQRELQKIHETEMYQYDIEYAAWEREKNDNLKKKGLSAKQTALKDLGPPPVAPLKPILFAEEPTYEGMVKLFEIGRPALGLFSDEGGRFLGGYAMGKDHQIKTAAGLSSLWDGRPVSRVRASDGSQMLYGRRLSAHLMVQPRIGLDLLSNPDLVDQGILSRFLVTYPATTTGTRFYRPVDVNEVPAYRKYRERMTAILETPLPTEADHPNQLMPRKVPLSSEAKEAWIAFHDAVERKLVDGGRLAPVRGLANKAPEHVARLACILTLVEDLNAPEIQLGAIEAGIELVTHFLNEGLRLLDVGNVNSELDDAQRLLDWLIKRGKPEVSLVEIYQRGPNSVREAGKARKLMRILKDHGWVFPLDPPVEFDGSMRAEGWGINL